MTYLAGSPRRRIFLAMTALGIAGCTAPSGSAKAQTKQGNPEKEQPKSAVSAPKVGDEAPFIALKMLKDDTKTVALTTFRGKRPVVLFFGSYT